MSKRRTRGLILLLLALSLIGCGLCVPGCSRVAEREAEKRVNTLLPGYLGPAEKYETRVEGDSVGAVMRGRLRRVHVKGTRVRLDPRLLVDRLTLDFTEVDVDTKAGRLRNVGSAAFECRISSAELDRYVRERRSDIHDLRLALKGDAVIVTARPEAVPGLLSVPVSVEGKLIPRGGTLLDFDPDRAKVSLLPIPGIVLDWLAKRLNPAVDLSAVPIPVQIERTQVRGGFLILSGSVAPEEIVRAGNNAAATSP